MAYGAISEQSQLQGARAQSIASYKNLLAARDGKLAAARKTKGPGSGRWKRTEEKLRDAKQKTEAVFAQLQRLTDAKRVSGWVFGAVAIAFAALEAPINKFMLDNILQGSNLDSYVLSLFLTLALLGLAHIGGQQARQIKGAYQEKIYISNIIIVAVIFAVLATCVGALTIGRAFYSTSAAMASGQDIFTEIRRQVVNLGPWQALISALSDQAAFFLACLNTAGLAVAFLGAFVTHDSDKVYQSALDERWSAERTLDRLNSKYDKELSRIARQYGPKLNNVAAAYATQNAAIVGSKRANNIPLNDEDAFDLTGLDSLLVEAREEISARTKADNLVRDGVYQPAAAEESQPTLPHLVIDRR